MAITSNDVANQAIFLIGNNQAPVTGLAPNFDTSPAGMALQKLYTPCVRTVARKYDWDFCRNTVILALTGNVAPFPWNLEYSYPANAVQIWQLKPATLSDPDNPLPLTWEIGNAIVSGGQKKVIWTNQPNVLAVINNIPNEDVWDSLFHEAVVRLLSSEIALAIAGKPESSQVLFETGAQFESIAETREG